MFKVVFIRELTLLWFTALPYLSISALVGAAAFFLNRYLSSYNERLNQFSAGFLASTDSPDLSAWVIQPYFETLAFLLMLVVPVLTARVISEERRSGNLSVIFASEVSVTTFVLAKFFAMLVSLCFVVLPLVLPLLWLSGLATTTIIEIATGSFSIVLLLALYLAVGFISSSILSSSISSAVVHLVTLFTLYFLHALPDFSGVLGYSWPDLLSPISHFRKVMQGLFQASSVGYFIATITAIIIFTISLLTQERKVKFLDYKKA